MRHNTAVSQPNLAEWRHFIQYGRSFLLFFNQSFKTIKGQGVEFVQSGFIISETMKAVTINAKKKSTCIKIKNVVRLFHK